MNFFGIGGFEIVIVALVAFLVLGPQKMAEAGKSIAKILAELRRQRDELTAALMDDPKQKTPQPALKAPAPESAPVPKAEGPIDQPDASGDDEGAVVVVNRQQIEAGSAGEQAPGAGQDATGGGDGADASGSPAKKP